MLRLGYAYRIWRMLDGTKMFLCPVCGITSRFRAAGYPPRLNAICQHCMSAERHRLLGLLITRHNLVRAGERVLHFAPEAGIGKFLRDRGADYQGADIQPGLTDLTLNLESIDLPDASVDVVLLVHVLEHVDDRRAMSEIRRILRPGGRMIAMVPIVEGMPETYEDASITDPDERAIEFGQWDHLRQFGRDFRDRLRGAGLTLTEHLGTPQDIRRHALGWGEVVFVGEAA